MIPEAQMIKESYIQPAVVLIETDFQSKKYGLQFHVRQKIWVDANLPEYRIAIPESFSPDSLFSAGWVMETRFITYKPTGRIIYDNTRPPATAVVWEYALHHSRDLVAKANCG